MWQRITVLLICRLTVLSKDPFLALLLWYSKKVGALLEKDESILMGEQCRIEFARRAHCLI